MALASGCCNRPQPATQSCPIPAEIDELWENRTELSDGDPTVTKTVFDAVELLDQGTARVAWVDPTTDQVEICERSRQAISLSFRVLPMQFSAPGEPVVQDRLPLKTRFDGVRMVAGAVARWGSYLAPGVVALPSFTNIGARVDENTMVDTWATVGTCAQIGKRVHLAGGAGIGGVMEPPGARPVVVEDDAFIGSRCIVVEGARVREGAKLGAGAILTSSTHVIDAETGAELSPGELPPWSLSVGSTRVRSFPGGDFGQPCILVLKYLDKGQVHSKLQIDDMLRAHGAATS